MRRSNGPTRREFLSSSVMTAASILFGRSCLAEEPAKSSIQKLEEILDMGIEVKDWKPIDVTDEIKAALEGKDALLFEPSSIACVSPNRKWWFSHIVPGRGNIDYYTKELFGDKYQSTFLFDSVAKKVYTLLCGDDKLARFPSSDFTIFGDPHRVANNGVTIYGVTWPWPRKERKEELEGVIIADINNSRKIVLKATEGYEKRTYWNRTDISVKGNRGIFQGPYKFCIFDIENQQVIYTEEGSWRGANYDASVIAYNKDMTYYRKNIKTNETTFLWSQDWSRYPFIFSPDGNFCACKVEFHGPSSINVYIHNTGERFAINHPIYRDGPESIDNDGMLYALSGTYKYHDGMYHWATEGKPQPEGLKIIKR